MKVSIVIPNWNGEEKLKRHLPKVLKVKGVDEVIVVDDASPDNSVAVIKNDFPNVKLVINERNMRFSATCNRGVKEASGELIFLLNNDASPDEDCLKHIPEHFKDPEVFSVGLNTGSGKWNWARFENGFFWHHPSKEETKEPHETLWASGGSGVFKKSLWEALNGMDEMYKPFYEEDTDLGYRALKRGYKNIFEPRGMVEHYKEKGVNEEYFQKSFITNVAQRNQLLFTWKNITSESMTLQHQGALLKMMATHPKYLKIVFNAFKLFPQAYKKRQLEKKESSVADEIILEKYD